MTFVQKLFNLRNGEESKDTVLKNIRANISFSGSNFWILVCAIIVASVGLNVNSTAVVIGAMLISPLMGPIVGAGFALGIYDFSLLKKSLFNLFIATIASLLVATVYFFLSPYKEAQSELLSRTSPNIYDVLVAFFGGLVGVIAATRVEKGNPIPGVAIATALMPPLCTAGYGLAIGNINFFGGALFLYIINCTFICIATYAVVKYLGYPIVHQINEKQEKRVKWIISTIVLAMIVPSIFFAYNFLKEQQFKKTVQAFIHKEFEEKGNTVVYQKTTYTGNPKKIELAFLSRKFNATQIKELTDKLPSYHLDNTVLLIRQDSAFLAENKARMDAENEKSRKDEAIISELQLQVSTYRLNTENIYPEAKAIFPNLDAISIGRQQVYVSEDSMYLMPVVSYKMSRPMAASEEKKLQQWLIAKLRVDTLELYKRN